MMEQAKLLSITTILTLLIWWSADSLVNETIALSVSFAPYPSPTSPGMLVEIDGDAIIYQVEVSGPRKSVEEFKARIGKVVRLRIPDRPTGPFSMSLDRMTVKQAFTEVWRDFRKVAVVSVDPNVLSLRIDHMITRDVEIVARRLSLSYEVEPQLQTAVAQVRMRESEFNKLPPGQSLQIGIGAEVERLLRERPAGKSETVQVPLDARRFGPDATITPNKIEVTATLQADRITAQVSTVPILFATSPANLEKRCRPATRDGEMLSLVTQSITVTGPREEVARLQRGDARIFGIIQLKQEDFETLGTVKLVIPEYRLPRNVELAQQPTPIEFKLVPVGAGEVER
jgi:hypothetical protein